MERGSRRERGGNSETLRERGERDIAAQTEKVGELHREIKRKQSEGEREGEKR